MARFLFVVLALLVAQAVSDVVEYNVRPTKIADKTFLQRQMELSSLFYHVNEPIYDPTLKTIVETFDLEKNVEQFKNVTALKMFLKLQEYNMLLPKSVPFNILEQSQKFETVTLFNLLYSAKYYSTFFKTAVYLRQRINEGLFVYVLSVAIMHYPETQGIVIPPIYDIFPSYFHNGKIMSIAERINTHGKNFVSYYPQTYVWDENVVIRWNSTVWPYVEGDHIRMAYYLNDYALNTLYYNNYITFPYWLSGTTKPLMKFKRGEFFWYTIKTLSTRYYMERLSNGLDEISELGMDVIQGGYYSGLVYEGVPLASRPNHFNMDQPKFVSYVERITELESRIRDAIEVGYLISASGEKIDLRTPEAIDVLGKVIEGNVDSPNLNYYGSIFNAWKQLLGNSIESNKMYWNGQIPLTIPSTLEIYQTTLRDPAFYMITKRILKLFTLWQTYLPLYTPEELSYPAVTIQKLEVDKLVTYFENTYLNVTNAMPMNEKEIKTGADQVSVLVQRPQLNHKVFKVRVNVKSDVAKTVLVKFFLAPKYDSKGFEIPLHLNTENFFDLDAFTYELPQGESVIKRDSTENMYMIDQWMSGFEAYNKAFKAFNGDGQFVIEPKNYFHGFPRRLQLPKGRIGGMPFQFLVYIQDYLEPKTPVGKGVNTEGTYGYGTGANRMSAYPLGFPLDRPLYDWQVKPLTNILIQEVQIFHKPVPEIFVPNTVYV
ncbi:acidic juvenile hormone-suppressible protein 1-like [Vanessa tameamea]|uniref:Acidic juvenile hormone-suppressible protein 1-like n=1 Tax=Vanessa tameamea TaxID=334116 RepID=A0A8B8II16_VANTA